MSARPTAPRSAGVAPPISGGLSSSSIRRSASTPATLMLSPKLLLSYILVGASCFYGGLMLGTSHSTDCIPSVQDPPDQHKSLMAKMQQQADKIESLTAALKKAKTISRVELPNDKKADDTEPRFSDQMNSFVGGMAAVDRTNFMERFQVGVPLQESSRGNQDVLLLYAHADALPPSDPYKAAEAHSNTRIPHFEDANQATENCDTLNLILVQPNDRGQCYALMGQYRSFHIHKFMRLPEPDGKLDRSAPLRLLNRGAQASGRLSVKVPLASQTKDYWKLLSTYLNDLDASLEALRPYATKSAVNNTLVVMVCNHGQSELLMNFACASRARGFDLKQVLVFATDEETQQLAHSLGLNVYYDEKNYGHIPKQAAGRYADRTFTQIMMAKVYCVQMTVMLGYDVLFQDVDVVWYRNPIDFFQDKANPQMYNHDIYFQDDGSRAMFYAPYSANTGMYFVRNNDRTRYFFNSLLLSGDLISATHSHQIALVSMLSEHASLYNLKVKVLNRDAEEFPGGFTYHKRHAYMKDLFANKVHPYIFHMSWTENKKNKQHFFRQMGNWYLQDKCVGTTVEKILRKEKQPARVKNASGHLLESCCSAEPLIKCFFRDKPSIFPCKDSVTMDEGKKSFW